MNRDKNNEKISSQFNENKESLLHVRKLIRNY